MYLQNEASEWLLSFSTPKLLIFLFQERGALDVFSQAQVSEPILCGAFAKKSRFKTSKTGNLSFDHRVPGGMPSFLARLSFAIGIIKNQAAFHESTKPHIQNALQRHWSENGAIQSPFSLITALKNENPNRSQRTTFFMFNFIFNN